MMRVSVALLLHKLVKGCRLLGDRRFRPALLRCVAATIEHRPVFNGQRFVNVVDVGANRGQFTLLMAGLYPSARIYAFEPLAPAFAKLRQVTAALPQVRAVQAAIGPQAGRMPINVAKRPDSSSLLAISPLQEQMFPNTGFDHRATVEVGPLDRYLPSDALIGPSLLKIDVQGFELQALQGCAPRLGAFTAAFVEASFMVLYERQALADAVIDYLHAAGLRLRGIFNVTYAPDGRPVQADFLFERPNPGRR